MPKRKPKPTGPPSPSLANWSARDLFRSIRADLAERARTAGADSLLSQRRSRKK